MIVDSVDYPFGNDRLTSVTASPNAVDNWAKLFDYARYSLMQKMQSSNAAVRRNA